MDDRSEASVTTIVSAHASEPDIVIGSREQLFHLLAEASEIEHTLMCSYLFAAFSLKTGEELEFSAEEGAAIKRWRKALMGVAIEEMGHLLIVANLTAALGGRPHFGRPNFPVTPGYFPSGVTLSLTPFNEATLDHFIFLERPTGISLPDGGGFEQALAPRVQPFMGLMPSVQDYATVSHLYESIRANLHALSASIGEADLFIGKVAGQIGPDLIELRGIELITGLVSAGRSLDLIVEQGEGGSADVSTCHYQTFSKVREELASFTAVNPNFAPAFPVVSSPVMRQSADMEDKAFVSARPAAQVLDFCNATYGLLLRLLVQVYMKSNDTVPQFRKTLVTTAFGLMHTLGRAAQFLATLQTSEQDPKHTAGVTFTMLRGVEPFLPGRPEVQIIGERLLELANGARLARRAVPDMPDFEGELLRLAQDAQSLGA